MAGNLDMERRITLTTANDNVPTYVGGEVTLDGVPVRRQLVALSYPSLSPDGYAWSSAVDGHYHFSRLVAGQKYRIIPLDDAYDQNGIFVDRMSEYGVDEFDIELNPAAGGGGDIEGYTLRSGDRLLVIDSSGAIVGLPPEP